MTINSLDHFNIRTSKPEQTVEFYSEILGLENAPERRPASMTPGTWILVNGYPAIHVNFVDEDQSNENMSFPTGSLDHVAFEGSGYEAYEALFKQHGIEYRKQLRPEINLCQLFLHDPNGVKIEVNIRGELDVSD